MINDKPLDNKKRLVSSIFFLFLNEMYAEVPAKKTKVGAHK